MNTEGTIKIALTHESAKDPWNANVSFTLGDQEVKCKTISVKVEGEKLDLVYEFNLNGLQAASTVTGNFQNGKLEGTYTTKGSDGSAVDQGTFKTALEQ